MATGSRVNRDTLHGETTLTSDGVIEIKANHPRHSRYNPVTGNPTGLLESRIGQTLEEIECREEIQEAKKEQRAALEILTKQLYHVAMSLGELRGNEGKIPATVQPLGRENTSEISLRSGKVYQGPNHSVISPATDSGPSHGKEGGSSRVDQAKEKGKEKVERRGGEGATLDGVKESWISKFVKDYLAGKINEKGRLITDKNVSVVIQRSDLPSKKTDPGMFTLPIAIRDIQVKHAMCDLGASINVLPYSIYRKLGAAKLVNTDIMI
ncbi:uncharacterized protein LOC121761199 [Salvia splendens]|uniref:uncharacterized protein LOC121761199 n=1 Tax=Salvia splendens TaxID=180675 RepID=UPI001C27875E|nr:uncharacterized protein LOC121761199 [Salvia splendens]